MHRVKSLHIKEQIFVQSCSGFSWNCGLHAFPDLAVCFISKFPMRAAYTLDNYISRWLSTTSDSALLFQLSYCGIICFYYFCKISIICQVTIDNLLDGICVRFIYWEPNFPHCYCMNLLRSQLPALIIYTFEVRKIEDFVSFYLFFFLVARNTIIIS